MATSIRLLVGVNSFVNLEYIAIKCASIISEICIIKHNHKHLGTCLHAFKLLPCRNLRLQCLQAYGRLSLWIFIWFLMSSFRLNRLSQMLHACGFNSTWMTECFFNCIFVLNLRMMKTNFEFIKNESNKKKIRAIILPIIALWTYKWFFCGMYLQMLIKRWNA